jgi:small subunit ribosomal protein S17
MANQETGKPKRGEFGKVPFTTEESRRNTKVGVVVSSSMQKSVVVAVENTKQDQRYLKYVKRTSKFMAHCENNDCKVGDRVVIEETRPLSRRKRWNVKEVLQKAT